MFRSSDSRLMAEKGCRESSTRRQSFRKSLAQAELPDDDLERLEAKRKQLDDSIHKYIAAKEREYKQFERELIQKHKLGLDREGGTLRRTSSESTQDPRESPRLLGQSPQNNAVNALLSAGLRRDQIGTPLAVAVVDDDGPAAVVEARPALTGLTDRRVSTDRDRDFIGVFTPAFLPAVDGRGASPTAGRAGSAPPLSNTSVPHSGGTDGVSRANSDSVVQTQAPQRRPVELQLANHRTSSSGSSADGRLPSALKSPTHSGIHSSRSRKKRVSLAVGDSIVAPSDNVPPPLNHNSTPSHSYSRARASAPPDMEESKPVKSTSPPKQVPEVAEASTTPFSPLAKVAMTRESSKVENSKRASEQAGAAAAASSSTLTARSIPTAPAPASSPPKKRADVDGDLEFGLDDEEGASDLPEAHTDSEDDITGRVAHSSSSQDADGNIVYESSEGLIPEADADESDDHAEHIEFRPSSMQQPTTPGFRRSSVSTDPIYSGSNYARAEHNAVTNEIYGSSFNRPANKGSFTPGSLGENFMALNADRMMKDRAAREQTQVRP